MNEAVEAFPEIAMIVALLGGYVVLRILRRVLLAALAVLAVGIMVVAVMALTGISLFTLLVQ